MSHHRRAVPSIVACQPRRRCAGAHKEPAWDTRSFTSRSSGRTERSSRATTPNCGLVPRDGNVSDDGVGIGGGVAGGPEGYEGHVTFYVAVPDVEEALAKAESLGGTRIFGPEEVMEGLILGQFKDPEDHVIGILKGS
jgi:hypothetical protein